MKGSDRLAWMDLGIRPGGVRSSTDEASAAGTLAARISTCGPPRAALVTVEPSGFGIRG